MVLGMLFENFKNYYILRYVIYEFLKKGLGGPQPTCLVRVFCAVGEAQLTLNRQADRTEDKTEDRTEDTACLCKFFHGEVCMFHCVLYQPQYLPERSSSIGKL